MLAPKTFHPDIRSSFVVVVLKIMSKMTFFPKQVYLWGSLLEKNRLDTLLGALGLVGRGFGCAGRAGLGWAWGARWLGWAWCWACWARWLGWAWCWAWGLAVLGALAGLGVVLGVGFGRASWVGRGVGRGVWPCWARWLGWAWCWACWARWLGWAWCWACWARWLGWACCWAWGLAALGALAGLGVVLGAGFGCAGRASWVGRGVGRGVWPCWARAGWVGRGFKVQKYTLEIQK